MIDTRLLSDMVDGIAQHIEAAQRDANVDKEMALYHCDKAQHQLQYMKDAIYKDGRRSGEVR